VSIVLVLAIVIADASEYNFFFAINGWLHHN
jgi:hypothetical protein